MFEMSYLHQKALHWALLPFARVRSLVERRRRSFRLQRVWPALMVVTALSIPLTLQARVYQAAPVATITTSSPVTAGATGLTASVPSQSGMTYAWTVTGGSIAGGQSANTVTYTAGGSGIITLSCTVTNTAGTAVTGTSKVMATPTGVMDVSGTYTDGWGYTFTLFQNGTNVWGIRAYGGTPGPITAAINGNVLSGTWTYSGSTYVFNWTFASDASSFSGLYAISPNTPDTAWTGTKNPGVSIQVSPTSGVVQTGATQTFQAYVAGSFNKAVTWTTASGTISASGVLTAPGGYGGNFVVTATSQADTTKSASAAMMATPTGVMDVSGTYLDQYNIIFTLFQNGTNVWGTRTYGSTPGTIAATMNGNVLSGTDTSSSSTLNFTWTFAPDASSFNGLYAVAPSTPNAGWSGTKQSGVSLQLSPTSASLRAGATQAFQTYVAGSFNKAVAWTATGGTIDANGVYTAPGGSGGNYVVTATSQADATKALTADVFVTPTGLDVSGTYADNLGVTFTLFQNGASVWGTRTFNGTSGTLTATLNGNVLTGTDATPSSTMAFTATFAADASSFSGLYAVAPATPNLAWTGTRQAGVSVFISPSTATVIPGATQAFSAAVAGSSDHGLVFSVLQTGGGTVTQGGTYTAPALAGGFNVGATSHADPSKTSYALVTVPVVVLVTPSQAQVAMGGTQTFTAQVLGSTNQAVTWAVQEGAAGGSITSAGVYTAPATQAGAFHVVATASASSTAQGIATATVSGPLLPKLSIAPSQANMSKGGTQTFVAVVQNASNPAVTWSCSGGSIDQSGHYTAPGVFGTFTVTAALTSDPTIHDSATVVVPGGSTSGAFTYDANGNMTGDGQRTFTWDAENRLASVTILATGHVSQFTYDGLGRRVEIVEKDSGATTNDTKYLWEGTEIAESRTAAGSTVLQHYYAQGFVDSDGTNLYYTRDHLGSVRELTDSTQAIRARYDYDPYGRMTKISGDRDSVFGYTGHMWHAQSGLFLTLFRAYDPNLGRWLARDPIEDSLVQMQVYSDDFSLPSPGHLFGMDSSINPYTYSNNNAINYYDSLGLKCVFAGILYSSTNRQFYQTKQKLNWIVTLLTKLASAGRGEGREDVPDFIPLGEKEYWLVKEWHRDSVYSMRHYICTECDGRSHSEYSAHVDIFNYADYSHIEIIELPSHDWIHPRSK